MKSRNSIISICFLALLVCFGCEYEKVPKPKVPANVSFSNDVIPIMDVSCSTSGCHASGAFDPDLSSAVAYNNLVGSLVTDSTNLKNNDLYNLLIVRKTMPKGRSLSSQDTSILFTWIRKGFRDN